MNRAVPATEEISRAPARLGVGTSWEISSRRRRGSALDLCSGSTADPAR